MQAVRRLRVGVIGCGAIAQIMHLPHLRELDERFALVATFEIPVGQRNALIIF